LEATGSRPQVFITHSSRDAWVAKQIAFHIQQCGALSFLDQFDLRYGDDFEEEILKAVDLSSEQLVLLTPWSKVRPCIWMEMGAFWYRQKRIVGILHGFTSQEIVIEEGIPVYFKKIHLLELNEIDLYFNQLRQGVLEWERQNHD
jgi:TIR domain